MTGRLNRSSGLFAQTMILRLLDHEAAQAQRHSTPITIIRLALALPGSADEASERDLRQALVHLLNTQLRAVDLPGHLENDYLLVLPITTAPGGRTLAARIVAAIAALDPPPLPGATACAGVAHHPGGPECDGNLLGDHATVALRAAQRRGPNTVVEFANLEKK
jgi:hypothetical protein